MKGKSQRIHTSSFVVSIGIGSEVLPKNTHNTTSRSERFVIFKSVSGIAEGQVFFHSLRGRNGTGGYKLAENVIVLENLQMSKSYRQKIARPSKKRKNPTMNDGKQKVKLNVLILLRL